MSNPSPEWYYEQIKDAVLEVLEEGQRVKVYRLCKYPGRGMMSSTLVFLENTIILTGDLRPTQKGCQAMGYGIDWFASELHASYLAEKFLDRQYVKSLAIEHWKDIRNDWVERLAEYGKLKDGEQPDEPELQTRSWEVNGKRLPSQCTIIEAIDELLEREECFDTPDTLIYAFPRYLTGGPRGALTPTERWECPFEYEDCGGYGYRPEEQGWLAAIQKRFAEVYVQHKETAHELTKPS